MPITFDCRCGMRCQVADVFAGRQARCPKCLAVNAVPKVEPPAPEELLEVLPLDEASSEAVTVTPTAKHLVLEDLLEVVPLDEAPAAGISTNRSLSKGPVRSAGGRAGALPRERRAFPESQSSNALTVSLVAGGLLLVCALVGGLAYKVYAVRSRPDVRSQLEAERRPMNDFPAVNEPPAERRAELDRFRAQAEREQQRRAEEWREQQERRREDGLKEVARRQEEARLERARRAEEEDRRKEQALKDRLTQLNKPLAEVTLPASSVGSEMPPVTRAKQDGVSWASVPLGLKAAGPLERFESMRAPPVAGACWAADGNSFFALTRAGVLRRFAYPDLKELRQIDLKQECAALAVCKFGLVLTLNQLQEIWIVAPDTLAVVKRFGVSQLLKALTGPDLGVAYVFCRETGRIGDSGSGFPVRISLEDGSFAAMLPARSLFSPQSFLGGAGFSHAVLSPNGKWLFAEGIHGQLVRYRIEDASLILDARSHMGMGGGYKQGICISPDSQWVCFPTGGGNDGAQYGTYIYRVDDLSRPAFTLHQGVYPEIVGFDGVGKRIFSQNVEHVLIVFDQNGTKRGQHTLGFPFGGGSHNIKQYASHPKDGRGLLLRTNSQLLLVEVAPTN